MRVLFAAMAAIALTTPAAPVVRAATMPTISEFTMSTHQVTVTGLQVAEVVIEARIVAPDGQGHGTWDDMTFLSTYYPRAGIAKSDGVWYLPAGDGRDMKLVSGSDTDGIWRATIRVPSTYHGHWSARVCAQAPNEGGEEGRVTCHRPSRVGIDDSLTVIGRDQPRIRVLTFPTRLPSGRIVGDVAVRVFLRGSGRPVRGRLLLICTYGCYNSDPPRGERARTDSRGIARFRLDSHEELANQVWLLGAPRHVRLTDNVFYLSTSLAPARQFQLSADLTPRSISLGASARLHGRVRLDGFDGYGRVAIQKWVSRTWKTIAYARIGDFGRWSYRVTPTRRGSHLYRVWKPGAWCDEFRCLVRGQTKGPFALVVR